jgi:hypothetical protein
VTVSATTTAEYLDLVNDPDPTNNTATASVPPRFEFSGFYQPVDNAPTVNKVNAGRAIPVKFSLGGDRGLGVLAAGSPNSIGVSCSTAERDR